MPKFLLLLWAVLCSSLILYLCLTDSSNIPKVGSDIPNLDKIAHFCFHFCFTISWLLYFRKELRNSKGGKYKAYFISFCLSVMVGVIIEVLQKYLTLNRAADVLDVLANVLGSLTAVSLSIKLDRYIDRI